MLAISVLADILGAFPHLYHLWYTPKAVTLVGLRWWDFRAQKKHYLLFDFCYFANLVLLLFVWHRPQDPQLFQSVFMLANGPLAWATVAFNHSLIFHSYPHITSLFIHISPLLLTYGLRWSDPTPAFAVCPEGGCNAVSVAELSGRGIWPFYIAWIVIYYIWIFWALRRRAWMLESTRGQGGTSRGS